MTITDARPVQRSGVAARLVALSSLLAGFAIALVMLWQVFAYPSLDPVGQVYSPKLVGPQIVDVATGELDDGLAVYALDPNREPVCEASDIGPIAMERPDPREAVHALGQVWHPVLRSTEPVSVSTYTLVCKNDGALYAVGPRDWPSVPRWIWLAAAIGVAVAAVGIAAAALTVAAGRRTPAV